MAYGYNNNYNSQLQGAATPQILANQTVQPLFPQPQGNVYNINSTLEVANVPVGAGMSVALCLPENTMYIKTMQNGNPMFYPYKITPYNQMENSGKAALDERSERHFDRMREGMYTYNEGKTRYKDGDSKQRMIDGVEMTMGAIVNFVESMVDFAETATEKEIVRKYVDKLKNI